MALSEKDQLHVQKWLENKCGSLRCTCCGHGHWSIVDLVTMPIGFDTHTTQFLYSQGIPQVSIVCQYCGHMLFFSTEVMGLSINTAPTESFQQSGESLKTNIEE